MAGLTRLPQKVFPAYHEGSLWLRQAVAEILSGVEDHYWPPDRCPEDHPGGHILELSRPDQVRCPPCHLAAATTDCSRCQAPGVLTALMILPGDIWLSVNLCTDCARLEMLR